MADPVRDFLGTDDGEWSIVNGDFATVSGAAAVRQGVRIRLGLILGECYLNQSAGVPYLDDEVTGDPGILSKNVDPLFVRGALEEAVAATPDVVNVYTAQLIDEGDRQSSIDISYDDAYSQQTQRSTVSVP